jgi:hypothetical protein
MNFVKDFIGYFKRNNNVVKFSDMSLLVKEECDNDDIKPMHNNWTEPTYDEKMEDMRNKCEELARKVNGVVFPITNGFIISREDGEDIVVQLKQHTDS